MLTTLHCQTQLLIGSSSLSLSLIYSPDLLPFLPFSSKFRFFYSNSISYHLVHLGSTISPEFIHRKIFIRFSTWFILVVYPCLMHCRVLELASFQPSVWWPQQPQSCSRGLKHFWREISLQSLLEGCSTFVPISAETINGSDSSSGRRNIRANKLPNKTILGIPKNNYFPYCFFISITIPLKTAVHIWVFLPMSIKLNENILNCTTIKQVILNNLIFYILSSCQC